VIVPSIRKCINRDVDSRKVNIVQAKHVYFIINVEDTIAFHEIEKVVE